jgi:uncharacterized protein (DUF2235 family)
MSGYTSWGSGTALNPPADCSAEMRVRDTVSSVGTIFRRQPLPLTTSTDHICHFRHALALDERRVRFLPESLALSPADEKCDPEETVPVESGQSNPKDLTP